MHINKHWSKISQGHQLQGKEYCFTVWGGSRLSPQDAEQQAQKKMQQLLQNFTGKTFTWSYDYAMSEIREPILKEDPDSPENPAWILTRNRYGALVLNAEQVVFLDVDVRPAGCLLFGKGQRKQEVQKQILEKLSDLDLAGHVYETAAGFRVVITDRLLPATDDLSAEWMKAFRADKLYATLCRKHECYRARLTPKPYRMGMQVPKITWENVETAEAQSWIREYEDLSPHYAVCLCVHRAPADRVLPEVQKMVMLHDRYCLAESKPLA